MNRLKKELPFLCMVLFCLTVLVIPSVAQDITSDRIKSTFNDEWQNWKDILATITTIVIAIGGIALGYAYATNRQESKDHLVKWIIALVIIAIVRLTVLT